MNFSYSGTQLSIIEAITDVVSGFDDDYWYECDDKAKFPNEFYVELAKGGWLGIAMPKLYGGSGLGITEAALMMQKISESGGGMTAASAVHINIFGPHPIVVHGTESQKAEWLPPLVSGKMKCCFGVTEPDAGLDTGSLSTFARRDGNVYRVNGQKIWTSTAQHAKKILLLARTLPKEQCKKSTDGLTLFYTDLDRSKIEIREIKKMGRAAVDSNQLFIDNLSVPAEDRIGDEGNGFLYLIDGFNPERILIAAEAIGLGRNALQRAVKYAKERVVFGRPIGKNQSIQHPLAKSWIALEAAQLLMLKAAYQYDKAESAGASANAAKYLAAESAFDAASNAVLTLGGMGYAKEFHVERLFRESLIPRLAPVSSQMVLNYISERVLGLPKSY